MGIAPRGELSHDAHRVRPKWCQSPNPELRLWLRCCDTIEAQACDCVTGATMEYVDHGLMQSSVFHSSVRA